MSKVVNLNQIRKQQSRAKKRAEGDENAAKFGRTKAQRDAEKQQAERARAHLDAHLRDPE